MTEHPHAVLSVDLELFSHTPAYRQASGKLGDDTVGLKGVDFLRERFADANVETTWYVVAALTDSTPGMIESLAESGHEIGSHTSSHRPLSDLTASDRRAELEGSKERLEDLIGGSVSGFRAPAFDLGPDHFSDLAAAGYEYDSSVVASRSIPGWYGGEFDRDRPGPAPAVREGGPADLAVLPVSVMPWLRLPLTGTWLRFFGPRYTILGMRRLARRGITPVLYVHPWEIVDLPRIEGVPSRVYYHTGAWMRRAVDRILETEFEFVTAREVLADEGLLTASPAKGGKP